MNELRYYLSIFVRRLPLVLPVTTVIAAVAVIVALTLPPAYVSETRMVVQSPQIPAALAPSTVQVPALERLQIIQQRLLTRENMLRIARELDVFDNVDAMNADAIVDAMRARTTVDIQTGRNAATFMTVKFEAPEARTAAEVLNRYLTLIQQEDAQFRRGRAGETLAFFEGRVESLAEDLDTLSAEILAFKNENTGALPESLDFRMSQRSAKRDQIAQIDRDIKSLQEQRERLKMIYELRGGAGGAEKSPLEKRLDDLRVRLDEALAVYSPEAPQVKNLQAQIAQIEEQIAAARERAAAEAEAEPEPAADAARPLTMLDIQLSEIDSRIEALRTRRETLRAEIEELEAGIEKTPEVASRLEQLNREYSNVERQLSAAQERLTQARTGDMIESRSRGSRVSVIEPPAVPNAPTKPNRTLIAGGGVGFGIMAGLALVALLELLNGTARRPEDLVRRFNIVPIATIPFIRSRQQMLVQRGAKVLVLLAILIGVPAGVYAVHTYYLPLDLIADRVMDKVGIRL